MPHDCAGAAKAASGERFQDNQKECIFESQQTWWRPRMARRLCVTVALCALALASHAAQALELSELRLRFGTDLGRLSESYSLADVEGRFLLPWQWEHDSGGRTDLLLDASIGYIDAADDQGGIVAIGPTVRYRTANDELSVEAGVRPALLSRHQFGRDSLGSSIQFVSHLGLRLKFGDRIGVGYRIQHMSNAGLASPNPGLDVHYIELSYGF